MKRASLDHKLSRPLETAAATPPKELALIAHGSPESIIAYRDGQPVSVEQFFQDTARLSSKLTGRHVLNTCQDRYHFAVGLAAALTSGRVTLMPSTIAPDTLGALRSIAPGYVTLSDHDVLTNIAPGVAGALPALPLPSPSIPGNFHAAWAFTSGSTGTPVPHPKTWSSLVRNVRVEAKRLGISDGRSHTIIGTVPAQHMYGFESTVLVALQSGCAFEAKRPFYPADICQAISKVPHPRLLMTTPVHLRSLLLSGIDVPSLDLVVSATAPLSEDMARDVEARLCAPVMEIYGCTETGQIATRRPTRTRKWWLFDGVELNEDDGRLWASGGHLDQRIMMQDVLQPLKRDQFLLHGRTTDMVNVAGKRSSLAYLNHQLVAVPGVIDGTFFMLDNNTNDTITRLTALVVAPALSASALSMALRQRIDPAFLPRPVIFVDALPRNAAGKLPREALTALVKAHERRTCTQDD